MRVYNLRSLGAILLIMGVAIGGGMLAIPLVTYSVGFFGAALALFATYALMISTALLLLEVNLATPIGSNFNTMVGMTLGRSGRVVTWLSYLFLMYALTSAYVAGGGSVLVALSQSLFTHALNSPMAIVLFTLVLGAIVVCGTRSVDWANRIFITTKVIALLVLVMVLLPDVKSTLISAPAFHSVTIWAALPILVTSFAFHIIIPSVRDYLPDIRPKRLAMIVFIGGSLPLLIYLIWGLVTLGVVPVVGPMSFSQVDYSGHGVGHLVLLIADHSESGLPAIIISIFTSVAVTTSFLGVSLSLFDFMIDGFHIKRSTHIGRAAATGLTYGIPLAFALFYPNGFILALGYASLFVVILLVLMPVLMVLALRRKHDVAVSYRAPIGRWGLVFIFIVGLMVLMLECLNIAHVLPH